MEKKYFVYVLVLVLAVGILFACGGDDGDGGETKSVVAEKNVLGEDSNGDGLWDDVEDIIEESGYSEDEKVALTKFAKAQQSFILSNTKEEAIENAHSDKTIECIYYLYPFEEASEMVDDLMGKIVNTEERILADIRANGYLSGETFEAPSNEELEIICNK